MKFDKIYNKVLTKILDEVNALGGVGVGGYAGPLEFKKDEDIEETEVVEKLEEQNSTKCLTSGAQFHISVTPNNIGVNVDLPFELNLNEDEAIEMETLLHNAIELVLSRYWN